MDRLALKMRLHKIHECGIPSSLIWHEVSKCKELVSGYLIIDGRACWHIWSVNANDEVEDMGLKLAELADPGFKNIQIQRVMDPPENMEIDRDNDVIEQFELYQNDPKKFWKCVDMKVQNFRARALRERCP